MSEFKVIGLDKVIANLNKEIAKLKKHTLTGLINGANIIMRDTEITPPLTPVVIGNLRASRFVISTRGNAEDLGYNFTGADARKIGIFHETVLGSARQSVNSEIGNDVSVVFGFSAYYARWTHEAIGEDFTRPGSGPHYLEASVKRNIGKVLAEIQKEAKIK